PGVSLLASAGALAGVAVSIAARTGGRRRGGAARRRARRLSARARGIGTPWGGLVTRMARPGTSILSGDFTKESKDVVCPKSGCLPTGVQGRRLADGRAGAQLDAGGLNHAGLGAESASSVLRRLGPAARSRRPCLRP